MIPSRIALLIGMLLLVQGARAEEPASAPVSAPARPPMFSKGSFTLSSDFAYTHTFDNRAEIPSLQVGVDYFVFDNLSLGAQLSGSGVFEEDNGDDAFLIGISALLRHHLLRWDHMSLFADVSFGPAEASTDVPGGGTRFNFITRAGLGVTYQLDHDLYLFGGAHYFHLSNARIEGVEHNPSMNGIEFYVGLMWPL